ncbi:hypothetical protein DEJ36_03115 [Curtobacterium sp. MCPF17_052]|nr:hypothetical protein [Curtobacterium sp. MCPF17_052]WIB12998.1 hypothetical protein DEJ36_03115 [Curtobacterium sp. MCPF17_052]
MAASPPRANSHARVAVEKYAMPGAVRVSTTHQTSESTTTVPSSSRAVWTGDAERDPLRAWRRTAASTTSSTGNAM